MTQIRNSERGLMRMTAHRSTPDPSSPRPDWHWLTREVIGAFFDVYNDLGFGLLESMYGAALTILLRERGFSVQCEHSLDVMYHGQRIGTYRADLIVEKTVVLELKAGAFLPPGSKPQLINYLRISGLRVGLLLWFGPVPEFKRVVVSSGCAATRRDQQ
jgi:GxxExxY protein